MTPNRLTGLPGANRRSEAFLKCQGQSIRIKRGVDRTKTGQSNARTRLDSKTIRDALCGHSGSFSVR